MIARLWPPRRPGVAIAVAVLLAAIALGVIGRFSSDAIDPDHLSRSREPAGLRTFTDLIRSYGGGVEVTSAGREIPADRTAIVTDPGAIGADEVRRLAAFVEGGGRIVMIGTDTLLAVTLLARPPRGSGVGAGEPSVVAPVPETGGIRTIAGATDRFDSPGEALPAIADADGAWLAIGQAGRGRVAFLASPGPLTNAFLARGDNAALALGIAGGAGRDLAFVDPAAAATGLAAIPTRWRWSLGLLTAAALTLVLALGRRLGPPDRPARTLPPPRRLYVESMARLVGRSRRPDEALTPIREQLAGHVARLGLTGRSTAEQAAALGLTDAEAQALLVRAVSEDDLLVAGRAFARIEQRGKART